jgi:hypothetical protein
MLKQTAVVLSIVVGIALSGCQKGVDYGPTGKVSGKLTMEGKPLSPGTQVVFMHPEKGYAAFGNTDAAGAYKITSWNDGNMPIGPYQVMIQAPAGNDDPESMTPEQMLDPEIEGIKEAEFPFKYRQTSTSGLSFEVKTGENTIDIDLTK